MKFEVQALVDRCGLDGLQSTPRRASTLATPCQSGTRAVLTLLIQIVLIVSNITGLIR